MYFPSFPEAPTIQTFVMSAKLTPGWRRWVNNGRPAIAILRSLNGPRSRNAKLAIDYRGASVAQVPERLKSNGRCPVVIGRVELSNELVGQSGEPKASWDVTEDRADQPRAKGRWVED